MGQPEKAKADDAQANKLSPESIKTYTTRARSMIGKKKLGPALDELNKALELEPRNTDALRLRAYVYMQQGDWEKAIADYTVAINSIREVDVEGRTRRGFAYRNLKEIRSRAGGFQQSHRGAAEGCRSLPATDLSLSEDGRERESDRRFEEGPRTEAG